MDSILVMKTITAKRNSKVKYIRTVLIRLNNPQLKGESRMQYVTMTFAGGGAITNDFLKIRKVIEFESSCIVILLLLYLCNHQWKKDLLLIKTVVKNLRS